MFVLQAPLLTDNAVVTGASVIILGLQAWQVKTTMALKEEVLTMRVHLFGATGDNGMNSTVNKLARDVEVLKEHQTA